MDQDTPNIRATRRRGLARVIVIILTVVALLGVAAVCGASLLLPHGDAVARGVSLLGADLGGLTRDDARTQIARALGNATPATLTLTAGPHRRVLVLGDVGIVPDTDTVLAAALRVGRDPGLLPRALSAWRARVGGVALAPAYSFDEGAARATLRDFGDTIDRDPVDAIARWDATVQHVVVTSDVSGQKLDVHASVGLLRHDIVAALAAGSTVPDTLDLPFRDKPAALTATALQSIDTVLGAWTTAYASSTKNRASNVAVAAQALDNTLVLPGDTFSFNDEVGPRDPSRGFLPAPVIMDGQLKPGMGGGVCQVSTTLYNAVLLANMKIVRRSHHSLPIHYAPRGQDATVAYGAIDFRFRNTGETPVLILTRTEDRHLTVQVLGHGPAPLVHIERGDITKLPMPPARLKPDPTLPAGVKVLETKGKTGVAVTVTRVVGDGPTAVREVISHDRYHGEAPVYRIGAPAPATPSADAPTDAPAED